MIHHAASRYMDPFNQDVIEAQQAEIARLGEQQKRDARSQQIASWRIWWI